MKFIIFNINSPVLHSLLWCAQSWFLPQRFLALWELWDHGQPQVLKTIDAKNCHNLGQVLPLSNAILKLSNKDNESGKQINGGDLQWLGIDLGPLTALLGQVNTENIVYIKQDWKRHTGIFTSCRMQLRRSCATHCQVGRACRKGRERSWAQQWWRPPS